VQKYKAIISDIDGTLTPNTPGALPSPIVAAAIRAVVQQGKIICFATGRPFHLVQYLVEHLNMSSPCIVDNGAVIVDGKTGAVLWEATLPTTHANRILKLIGPQKLVRASCDRDSLENPNKIPATYKVRKLSVHDIPIEHAEALISKVTTEFKDVAAIKAASYAESHLVDVYFSDAKATKQYAVLKLAEMLNLETTEMIGIGDGYNDFPLLMACGLKVAMGNAVTDLKAIADEVAPSVDEDGLAFILKKYLSA
jgi:Cof subfamily protein (haloacid dehalogenase superfamily)